MLYYTCWTSPRLTETKNCTGMARPIYNIIHVIWIKILQLIADCRLATSELSNSEVANLQSAISCKILIHITCIILYIGLAMPVQFFVSVKRGEVQQV